jgi:squalene-associated FAD-dependent desaturase
LIRTAHIIGGGLAGLSAAIACGDAGSRAIVYEAGPQPGGRCRSYFDRELGCRVDNGNHLLLSGNRAAFAMLDRIGSRDTLGGPGRPLFPFLDLTTGERWTLRPSAGRLPWWIFDARRRVPGTRPRDYLALLALRRPKAGATIAGLLHPGTLYRRLIEPLAIAALNTRPEAGAATLMAAVVNESLGQGGASCIPAFPREGWSETLIDPAVALITRMGGEVQSGRRVVALRIEGGRVGAIETSDGPIELGPEDGVVLAVPPWIAPSLLPGLTVPTEFEAILNVHFAIEAEPGEAGFIGLIGGVAEWVFVKPGHVSVTISAANRRVDDAADRIAAAVWPNVQAALNLPEPMPRWRVVKEKRATFAATPAQDGLRPRSRTPIANLALAGDWTATGLPATIEGAIRSGRAAAGVIAAA